VLAAQFGFLPGFIWIIIGAALAGAVHDFVILFASVRHDGLSLSRIAHSTIGRLAGGVTSLAILFIITMTMAGVGIAVVTSLAESPWGTFTIAMTIPAAIFVGLYIYVLRPGRIAEGSAIGVALVLLAVALGHPLSQSPYARYLMLSEQQLKIALPIYAFIASVLPVWLLLCPRDYLSSYMKIGVVALLGVGVAAIRPGLRMPAVTEFVGGGGPIFNGPAWPYVSIIIMCGAISGFHALVASGTTPKMISSEAYMKQIGYGAMILEGMVAVLALVAAAVLHPSDYFAINVPAAKQSLIPAWASRPVELGKLTEMSGEARLAGRPGGAVSLAVGMASVFSSLPGMRGLMAYWYHFIIMFEALFILTVLDTGTRVARFIFTEALGPMLKPLGGAGTYAATLLMGALSCLAWGYLLWTGDISTIWPMFGIANQLLAALGLALGTTVILSINRPVYALVTAVPLAYVLATTFTAGMMNIFRTYLPHPEEGGYVQAGLTAIMLVLVALIVLASATRWVNLLREKRELPVQVPAEAAARADQRVPGV
jgi:carbon starvation protein